jgi:hypothetical protein
MRSALSGRASQKVKKRSIEHSAFSAFCRPVPDENRLLTGWLKNGRWRPRSDLPHSKETPHLRENEMYGVGVKRPSIKSESQTPLVERAYELARTGAFSTSGEIRDRLKREGYGAASVQIHFQGRAIRDDLGRICREASAGSSRSG